MEIKSAFYKLAKIYHPDQNSHASANAKFNIIKKLISYNYSVHINRWWPRSQVPIREKGMKTKNKHFITGNKNNNLSSLNNSNSSTNNFQGHFRSTWGKATSGIRIGNTKNTLDKCLWTKKDLRGILNSIVSRKRIIIIIRREIWTSRKK